MLWTEKMDVVKKRRESPILLPVSCYKCDAIVLAYYDQDKEDVFWTCEYCRRKVYPGARFYDEMLVVTDLTL